MSEQFDAIVIGAGEAGALFASRAVAAGARVAMIYRAPYGSTCVNVGCVPSKFLIARARVAHIVRSAGRFGVRASEPSVDLSAIVAEKNALVYGHRAEGLANARRAERLTLLEGAARFSAPHEIEVGDRRLTSDRIVIATGMRPAIPTITGLADVPYLTNETVMDLTDVPAHLIVLGGGYVGVELAHAYRRFGAEVTLVGRNHRLVPGEEPEASEVVANAFASEAIGLHLGRQATRIEPVGSDVRVRLDDGSVIDGSELLVATGRRANTADLSLDAAGVTVRDDSSIPVDDRLRTNVPSIWAIGDVNGEQPFTRVCQEEAKVAFAAAFEGSDSRIDRLPLGHAVFSDPEVASVGLTEAAARASGRDVVAGVVELGQVEKAELLGETRGVIKIVAERETRMLLGLHVVAPHAADLVAPAAQVLRRRGRVDELATVGIFPTLAEGIEGTARGLLRQLAAQPAAASLTVHHAAETTPEFACPACGAEYEVASGPGASEAIASFACEDCSNELEVRERTGSEREVQPIRILAGPEPADSFACPACAGELTAEVR